MLGLVEGETLTFETTGSQLGAGVSHNTMTLDWNGTARPGDYVVVKDLGRLLVTESTAAVLVTTKGGTFVYDGAAHTAEVTVNLPQGYTLEEGNSEASVTNVADGEVEATADILTIRNA